MSLWLFTFLMSWAQAGYLQIVGEPQLKLHAHEQGLLLSGSYQIQNKGDETAREVFPEIGLEEFTWKGESRDLQAGETQTWAVLQVIPAEKLKLPLRGVFAFSMLNHYQDVNTYPFAIPSVELISLDAQKLVQPPQLDLVIEDDQTNLYKARVKIFNPSSQPLLVQPQPLLPREVVLQTTMVPLNVQPRGELETSFRFLNRKGLVDSFYQVHFILTWTEQGQRQAAVASGGFKIHKPKPARQAWGVEKTFWAWLLWIVGVGLIGMWAFWIRPLRRFRKNY